jgi:hypothetical protein
MSSYRKPVLLVAALCAVASSLLAVSATPLVATFFSNLSSTGYGVSNDATSTVYTDGVGGVRCYFGVNNKDLDLVTYNSGRKLKFKFNPSSPAWKSSGLPQSFSAEVDFYGINYFGPYQTQGNGTTAQVAGYLQFHFSGRTYELAYQSLASYRVSNTWLITWYNADIPGFPGFSASSQAKLSVFRNKRRVSFGAVNMPIRFQVTPK